MSRLKSTNNNVSFTVRTPTSVAPLKSPCFSVYHYNSQACSSGYVGGFLGGKRKSNSENMFHPITKQHITEARIAASMQRLSLENSFSKSEEVASVDKHLDEGFFEDNLSYNNDDVLSTETDECNLPKFKLAPDIKDSFDGMLNSILPEQIYRSVNQTCMALIPYVPPTDILFGNTNSAPKNEENEQAKSLSVSHLFLGNEMNCDDAEEVMCIN